MSKNGYTDPEIANAWKYRFFCVFLMGIPLGLFIRNRPLRPIFYTILTILPLAALTLTYFIPFHNYWLIYPSLTLIGVCDSASLILMLPYILRNVPEIQHTRAFALNAGLWSAGALMAGAFVFGLNYIAPTFFEEQNTLYFFGFFGFLGVLFLSRMSTKENIISVKKTSFSAFGDYDWGIILRAAFPTLMIALGAGLTIPYLNLFFYHIFGMESHQFGLMATFSSVLVIGAMLFIPNIKDRFSYEAISYSQILGTMVLLMLAMTGVFNTFSFMIYIAIFCFVLRQPLMHISNPMISEMTMYYVGDRNKELMSAITSSIWSGSWFISSIIFQNLRAWGYSHSTVIFITVGLYALGIVVYHLLILDFRRRERELGFNV